MEPKSIGINTDIVRALNHYKGIAVPVGFLAGRVGRSTPEVAESLAYLQTKGVVKIQGESVSLAPGF